jgi:dipeptidyl aminopeptidase/acylaminoacyl peptidase
LRLVALVWLFIPAGILHADAKPRPMTVDDVMKVRHIVEASIAPDGSQVVYVISEPDLQQNQYNTDLWLVPAAGGAATKLTAGPKQDDTPRWSPDGKTIAFLSDRDGTPQIWLIAPAGGEARKLTKNATGIKNLAWSPDGSRLAFLALDPDAAVEGKAQPPSPDITVVDQHNPREHLHVIGEDGGGSRQLTRGPFTVDAFSWSPDGKTIAYARKPTMGLSDQWRTDLFVVSAEKGESRPLVERPGIDTLPVWSPDGKTVAFVSNDGAHDWLANTFLCVVPAAGGKPRKVSERFDGVILGPDRDVLHGSPDGKRLLFAAEHRAGKHLFEVALETGEVKGLTSGDRIFDGFSFSRDRTKMACLLEDPATPREVHVADGNGQQPKRLTVTNPQLKDIALGRVEPLRWKSFDGKTIEGLLIKPVGYEAGKRYPLLTYVHGGPALQFMHGFTVYPPGRPQASRYPVHVLAGQGYAVFCPNPRGSAGYGLKFRQANVKDWGGGDYRDIMAGVDHLIAQGIADPDRLGIMGWSYGGYMTSWIIGQTDRFKAASAGAGVTNLFSMYGQTDIPDFMERYLGDVPWKARELYLKHSPMTYAGNIKTPTLIQHGEKDRRVSVAQSQELYHALKRNGVPVEFVIYARQGHNPHEPRLQRDVLTRNVEWFNRWLKK